MPLFTIDMFTVTVAQEYGSGVVEMVVVVVVCTVVIASFSSKLGFATTFSAVFFLVHTSNSGALVSTVTPFECTVSETASSALYARTEI